MKKAISCLLCLALLALALVGCGGGDKPAASAAAAGAGGAVSVPEAISAQAGSAVAASEAPPAGKAAMIGVTFSNTAGVIFNEIYITPTAADDLGDELLGSTRILKSNGSIEVEVPAYDYDNYDIVVVDENRETYAFNRVALKNGDEIVIYMSQDGLTADVQPADGGPAATFLSAREGESGGGAATGGWIEFSLTNGTRAELGIAFDAVYIMPPGTVDEEGIGYNHIEAHGRLTAGSAAAIGVDAMDSYDMLLLDADGSGWYYQSVVFAEGCEAAVTSHNGLGLWVSYADGSTSEFLGNYIE